MRRVAVPQVMKANLGQGKPPNEIGEVVRQTAGLFRRTIFSAANEGVARLPDSDAKQLLGLRKLQSSADRPQCSSGNMLTAAKLAAFRNHQRGRCCCLDLLVLALHSANPDASYQLPTRTTIESFGKGRHCGGLCPIWTWRLSEKYGDA
jgi:hypothetical protein